jgi:hypothetical protein
MADQPSLPRELSRATLSRIVDALQLVEIVGPSGGPLMELRSSMSPDPVGAVRAFTGDPLQQLVTVSLAVPAIGLDSHMLFAFTKPESAVPHFTVDAVFAGGTYAFHLDLIPRVDIGSHLPYLSYVMEPLTEAFLAGRQIEGLSPAQLSPRQLALMSPWMLAYRADDAGFRAVAKPVATYLDHWLALVERGVPTAALEGVRRNGLAQRDARSRAALFNPEVDPVWNQVARLVGQDTSARICNLLRSQPS